MPTPGITRLILVVDRERSTVYSLVGLLKLAGYNAVGAYGYGEALTIACCATINLLICESEIQSLAGVSLIVAIRGLYPLKAFGICRGGSNEEVAALKAAGFDRLFLRPIEFQGLEAAVDEVFGEHPPPFFQVIDFSDN